MRASIFAPRWREEVPYTGGLLWAPPTPPPRRAPSFRERGFSFIDLRPAHLEFMGAVYAGRSMPTIDEVVGRAMVDENYLPLGCVLVYFEPDIVELEYRQRIYAGKNWLYAHFAKWLRVYPKDILRAMSDVADHLREHEIFVLHASADDAIDGSDYLLEWLGAKPTGERDVLGPLYRLDLRRCKI
jgi:hypothetical protein